jgi:hypothetical protein
MIAATRIALRGGLRRAFLLAWTLTLIRYHQFIVDGDLAYMEQLRHCGILDGVSLRAFRREIARRECLVVALDADARALRQELRA